MKKKFLILIIVLTSFVTVLPWQASVYANGSSARTVVDPPKPAPPQIRIQIGRRHDRDRHRGWYQGRRMTYYHYNYPGYSRQVYTWNGRRYYRWYRYD